ncbi:pentapeptide repeat-containing protein [Kibdelosporangium lantanae]
MQVTRPMSIRSGAVTTRELHADCSRCFALCCVALAFRASSDFAVDKEIGDPCRNLKDDYRCGIHARLRTSGFTGCTVYDCFGAGQRVSQETFGGTSWRDDSRAMFDVFPVMRQLHELLWYLTSALDITAARPAHQDVRRMLGHVTELAEGKPDELLDLDVAAVRQEVNVVLLRVSELVRAQVPGRKKDRRGADLMGARFRGADLRGVNLRGAYLIGADLRDADLRKADLIGVDLRDADLTGADLSDSVFLTQTQVNAAKGSAATRLPAYLTRPTHWR